MPSARLPPGPPAQGQLFKGITCNLEPDLWVSPGQILVLLLWPAPLHSGLSPCILGVLAPPTLEVLPARLGRQTPSLSLASWMGAPQGPLPHFPMDALGNSADSGSRVEFAGGFGLLPTLTDARNKVRALCDHSARKRVSQTPLPTRHPAQGRRGPSQSLKQPLGEAGDRRGKTPRSVPLALHWPGSQSLGTPPRLQSQGLTQARRVQPAEPGLMHRFLRYSDRTELDCR